MIALLALLLVPSLFYGQEFNFPQNSKPIDELISLRRKYLKSVLSSEELFRLANLYLISAIYPKSAELYAELIQNLESNSSPIEKKQRDFYLARSHYNRGLALFSLDLFESAKVNFERARYYDDANNEALRMLGSIAFAQKNVTEAITHWESYIEIAPEGSARDSVLNALLLLKNPNFSFDEQKPKTNQQPSDRSWPFRSYDAAPYPDALYEKKRVI